MGSVENNSIVYAADGTAASPSLLGGRQLPNLGFVTNESWDKMSAMWVQSVPALEIVAASAACALFTLLVWRRFFSSTSDIRGPVVASMSTLWQIWHIIRGDTELAVMREHQRHGKKYLNCKVISMA